MRLRRVNHYIAILMVAAMVLTVFNLQPYFAQSGTIERIRIGLSYNTTADNNFTIRSAGGITIGVMSGNTFVSLINHSTPTGITVRRDSYYNINGTSVREIAYSKNTAYQGEVIGPFHIQVGELFSSFVEANRLLSAVQAMIPQAFLAYEGGWRVWTHNLLEESECLQQIEFLRNQRREYSYSVVYPDKRRIQLLDAASGRLLHIFDATTDIRVIPNQVGQDIPLIEYKNARYRGELILRRLQNSDITVINELPFEQYLYSVVGSESIASWPAETLKAQAVASRSYAHGMLNNHSSLGFNLCASKHCQAYQGFGREHRNTISAVDATKGQMIYHNGKVISALYHSSSGGHTENSENVFANALPYLRGVEDKFSLGSPHDNWANKITSEDIKKRLTASKVDIGDVLDVAMVLKSPFGRMLRADIIGTKGTKTYVKQELRTLLTDSILRSTWFDIETDADVNILSNSSKKSSLQRISGKYVASAKGVSMVGGTSNGVFVQGVGSVRQYNLTPSTFTFRGKGWGHSVGMSQYGTRGMAQAGYNYIQILEYYYTGAKVQ